MRLSLAAFLLAFTSVSTCMHITSPKENECVDLTKQLLVEWSADSSEVVATPFVSIRLANQRGAWPNVNEPLALGNDFEVPTRRGFIAFPRMGVENAEHFASINNGQGFTLRLVQADLPPSDISHFHEVGIRIVHPGQLCY